VVVDFRFRVRLQRSKHVEEEAAKMFKERVLKEGPWHEGGDVNSM
jgi:predicted Zn-dependent protease